MSTKGTLNREQAVALVGEAVVKNVEAENCDFTGRVQTDGDTRVEFSASIRCNDGVLVAYYYQEEDAVGAVNDLGDLSWGIHGYEVICAILR